ncbi:MAG: hypothetical protein GXX86_02255 [Propionibacterium sp.]|nr:hypothetical protein [Propionibacterium sp.]
MRNLAVGPGFCVFGGGSATNPVDGSAIETTTGSLTCVFNDVIAGRTGIKGTGEVRLQAVTVTEATGIEVDLNDVTTTVPLPGEDGGIHGPPGYGPLPENPTKWAGEPRLADDRLWWGLNFTKDHAAASAGASNTITFRDTLTGGGHVFHLGDEPTEADRDEWRLVLWSSQDEGQVTRNLVDANGDGEAAADYRLQVNFISKTEVEVTAVALKGGGFDADTNYQIAYHTWPTTESGTVQPGFTYQNSAQVGDGGVTRETSQRYRQSVTVDIEMLDGMGALAVEKALTGEAADQLAADTTLVVEVAWQLPAGTTAADYPHWTAPANPLALSVTAGEVTTPVLFPAGTELTLTERDAGQPGLVVVPEFVAGDASGSTLTLTIGHQIRTDVVLTNTVTVEETPEEPPAEQPEPEPDTPVAPRPPAEQPTPEKVTPEKVAPAKPGAMPRTGVNA